MVGQISRAGLLWPSLLFVAFCAGTHVAPALGAEITRSQIEQKISQANGGRWIWPISI